MSVKVGSARSSFGDTSRGDQAGGKEVSTQAWYLHSKGWILLRPKSATVASDIAYAMQAACDNNRIGYSQPDRMSLYNHIKTRGFDPKNATDKVNTDCSALVRVCCLYAGIQAKNFTTSNEVDLLMATGAFTKLTAAKYTTKSDYLMAGDILVTKEKGHTVVVLSDGSKAEKRTASKTIKIVGGSWNVRADASKDSTIVGVVHEGDVMPYYEIKDGWYRVGIGWVSAKAVKTDAN